MKKVLALLVALVMAFSMTAMASAADASDAEAILNDIIAAVEDGSALEAVEGAVIDIIDAIEDTTADLAAVEGEVINLETVLGDIPGVDGLVDGLKEVIKGMYAGEIATVPVTEAEEPADTGSTSAGIVAFAAISVAAAAAYVCTKKN